TVLETLVEHEARAREIFGERIELATERRRFVSGDHADPREPFDVRLARRDVVKEKLAIEHDVVAREKTHDARVDRDAVFLPEQIAHRCVPPSFASAASGASSTRSPLARCLSSTTPLASPRGPTTSCHGNPIRSIVENLTPARSGVSS